MGQRSSIGLSLLRSFHLYSITNASPTFALIGGEKAIRRRCSCLGRETGCRPLDFGRLFYRLSERYNQIVPRLCQLWRVLVQWLSWQVRELSLLRSQVPLMQCWSSFFLTIDKVFVKVDRKLRQSRDRTNEEDRLVANANDQIAVVDWVRLDFYGFR